MAAVTFEDQVLNYIGEVLAGKLGLTNAMLEQWFNGGVRITMRMLPKDVKKIFSGKVQFAPTTGIVVEKADIIEVLRKDSGSVYRLCDEVDVGHRGDVLDSGSIHLATARFPRYWLDPQLAAAVALLKIAPVSVVATDGELVSLQFPTVDIDAAVYVIAGFPDGLEELPVLYTVAQVKGREMGLHRISSLTEVDTIITDGLLADFTAALPTYVSPAGISLPALTLTTINARPADLVTADVDISALSAPTYTSPIPVLPSLGTLPGDLSEANITPIAVPTYSAPTPPSVGSITLPPTPGFSGITLPSDPTVTITEGTVPSYVSPTFAGVSSTVIDAAITQAKAIMDDAAGVITDSVFEKLDSNEIEDAMARVQAAAQEVNRAQAEIQHQSTLLQGFQSEVQQAATEYGSDADAFRADLEQQVSEARVNIDDYTAKVSALVQEWNVEEVQFKLNQYQIDANNVIQKFTQETSADLNKYGTDVQEAVGQFQADIGLFGQEVTQAIQQYSAEATSDVQIFTANLTKQIQSYVNQSNTILSKYQIDVQEALGQFQADIQLYAQQVNQTITIYTAEIQSDATVFAANLGKVIQEFQVQTGVELAEFGQKSNNELTRYGTEVQETTNQFQADLQRALSFLQVAGVRLQTAQQFDQKSAMAQQGMRTFMELFYTGFNTYLASRV